MPFDFKKCDCSPLVVDNEFSINDEAILAEYVGTIILGHYSHVKRIITKLSSVSILPKFPNDSIDIAIEKLKSVNKSVNDITKRDGWIFQIISWIVLIKENQGELFFVSNHMMPQLNMVLTELVLF